MKYYSSIGELIHSVDTMEASYRNLHTNVFIKTGDDTIKIPYKSIVAEYLPYLKETAVQTAFSPLELTRYKYKPKMLSNDLYGTTEYWSALLELNGFISLLDLTLEEPILVFEPRRFKKLINEILILEEIIK